MRRSRIKPDFSWPSWRYGPDGEAEIFQCAEDVPEGWVKKPGDVPEPYVPRPAPEVLDRDELIKQLTDLGIEVDHTWANAHMKKVIAGDVSSTR